MPGIRERLGDWLLQGRPTDQLRSQAEMLLEAYKLGPGIFPPEQLVGQLRESGETHLATLMTEMLQYDISWDEPERESDRLRAVRESRRLYRHSVETGYMINLWTNFSFGERVEVVTTDHKAQKVWDEFWTADRNKPVLSAGNVQDLSRELLKDGEEPFALFVNEVTGRTRIRVIPTEQITDRVCDPLDDDTVVFYVRTWTPKGSATPTTLYYPDWLAFLDDASELEDVTTGLARKLGTKKFDWHGFDTEGQPISGDDLLRKLDPKMDVNKVRADRRWTGTFVCMMHVPYNRKETWRG